MTENRHYILLSSIFPPARWEDHRVSVLGWLTICHNPISAPLFIWSTCSWPVINDVRNAFFHEFLPSVIWKTRMVALSSPSSICAVQCEQSLCVFELIRVQWLRKLICVDYVNFTEENLQVYDLVDNVYFLRRSSRTWTKGSELPGLAFVHASLHLHQVIISQNFHQRICSFTRMYANHCTHILVV